MQPGSICTRAIMLAAALFAMDMQVKVHALHCMMILAAADCQLMTCCYP